MKTENEVFSIHRGTTPLLISLPHVGTEIPKEIQSRLQPFALNLDDTDWHLQAVYEFSRKLGAGIIVPRYSRYVIDLNRSLENTKMYLGINNTDLCPVQSFSGEELYANNLPTQFEIKKRTQQFWQPYHTALKAELTRLGRIHGYSLLWDGHSIKSELPWLFEGRLPDLNLGTVSGSSCSHTLAEQLYAVMCGQQDFSHVINGRFKGGYITRHYGRPGKGVHAVQMEMSMSCYMQETLPYALDRNKLNRLQPILEDLIRTMLSWKPNYA